jgi:hypothetical protein
MRPRYSGEAEQEVVAKLGSIFVRILSSAGHDVSRKPSNPAVGERRDLRQ